MTKHRGKVSRAKRTPKIVPVIIILGPQGSGKGTQADYLARKYRLVHIEVGGMFRKVARNRSSAFGRQVSSYIDRGKLVPFDWVLRMLRNRFKGIPKGHGIILDGSPRRLQEAHQLLTLLSAFGWTVTHVFYLSITKRESIRRLSKRWVCLRCHSSLTMGKDIQSPDDRCPKCGGKIVQRADDTPKAIAKRLALFKKETTPVVRFFRSEGLLIPIDGEQPIPLVARMVDRGYRRTLGL